MYLIFSNKKKSNFSYSLIEMPRMILTKWKKTTWKMSEETIRRGRNVSSKV